MASLPLDANVQFLTVMATKMPFVGTRLARASGGYFHRSTVPPAARARSARS